MYVVEPVGRYDWAGWADLAACEGHVADVVKGYIGDDMPRVQVRYFDTPPLPVPVECCCEGCGVLVGDGFGMCHNCERDVLVPLEVPL